MTYSLKRQQDRMTSRQLWLLRHAKSDWTHDLSDFERPLNEKGERQISALTDWMQVNQCQPQRIITSPAVRALSTAQYVAQQLLVPLTENAAIYDAELDTLLAIIHQLETELTDVMLVGHNPGFSMLLGYLAGWRNVKKYEYNGEVLRPGSLAQLHIEGDWADLTRNSANCLSVTHGKKLEKNQS